MCCFSPAMLPCTCVRRYLRGDLGEKRRVGAAAAAPFRFGGSGSGNTQASVPCCISCATLLSTLCYYSPETDALARSLAPLNVFYSLDFLHAQLLVKRHFTSLAPSSMLPVPKATAAHP